MHRRVDEYFCSPCLTDPTGTAAALTGTTTIATSCPTRNIQTHRVYCQPHHTCIPPNTSEPEMRSNARNSLLDAALVVELWRTCQLHAEVATACLYADHEALFAPALYRMEVQYMRSTIYNTVPSFLGIVDSFGKTLDSNIPTVTPAHIGAPCPRAW